MGISQLQLFAQVQMAAQATFKSIKAVIPLLDRVLVQRFKPETVRHFFYLIYFVPILLENCLGHIPSLFSYHQPTSRGYGHCCRSRRAQQGWQYCPHPGQGWRPSIATRMGRKLDKSWRGRALNFFFLAAGPSLPTRNTSSSKIPRFLPKFKSSCTVVTLWE